MAKMPPIVIPPEVQTTWSPLPTTLEQEFVYDYPIEYLNQHLKDRQADGWFIVKMAQDLSQDKTDRLWILWERRTPIEPPAIVTAKADPTPPRSVHVGHVWHLKGEFGWDCSCGVSARSFTTYRGANEGRLNHLRDMVALENQLSSREDPADWPENEPLDGPHAPGCAGEPYHAGNCMDDQGHPL
jgi:hypothetical protein